MRKLRFPGKALLKPLIIKFLGQSGSVCLVALNEELNNIFIVKCRSHSYLDNFNKFLTYAKFPYQWRKSVWRRIDHLKEEERYPSIHREERSSKLMPISLVLVVSHIFFISLDVAIMLIYPLFINLENLSILFPYCPRDSNEVRGG